MFPFWLALTVPSAFVVQRYAGWWGMAIYFAATAAILPRVPHLPSSWSPRRIRLLAAATVVLVAALFAAVYPVVNTHDPFTGSDDDDAQNVGVAALLAGRSPYGERTYLGNELHHLPGALLVAAPFALIGTSALQNLFWLGAFFLAVRHESGSGRAALRSAWIVLAMSPAVLHGVVTGTAHVSNAIYVALGLWWLMRTERRDAGAVVWGVALASRANFLFLLPLATGWLWCRHGWRVAVRAAGLATATAAAITLPFYLHDPAGFGPLEAADRLTRFDAVIPHAGLAVIVLMAALSAWLGAVPADRAGLFRQSALVQAVPATAGLLLSTVADGQPDLRYAAYGTFAAWFVFIGAYNRQLP